MPHTEPSLCAAEAAERLSLIGRELAKAARTFHFNCLMANVPLPADEELTYICNFGRVTVNGSSLHIQLPSEEQACAR
jgi:hypothetical protein